MLRMNANTSCCIRGHSLDPRTFAFSNVAQPARRANGRIALLPFPHRLVHAGRGGAELAR
jgi:hypothetical protein